MLYSTWEDQMPTDSLFLSIAVCGVFLLFAAVLAVIDHRTTSWQREKAARESERVAAPVRKRAA
jgi:hypothetical protein